MNRIASRFRTLAMAGLLATTLGYSFEAHAGADKSLDAYLGAGYSNHDEHDGSGSAHAGGFQIELAGWLHLAPVFSLKWEMVELEGIFSKESAWFHIGTLAMAELNLRFVHISTGLGLHFSRAKLSKDGDTEFRIPAGIGFRWPVEIGFHFSRFGLYGGLEFDWISHKRRLSENALLGNESKVYAGLTLNFSDRGLMLRLEYDYRMLDDDFVAHSIFVAFDLIPAIARIMNRDSYSDEDDEEVENPYIVSGDQPVIGHDSSEDEYDSSDEEYDYSSDDSVSTDTTTTTDTGFHGFDLPTSHDGAELLITCDGDTECMIIDGATATIVNIYAPVSCTTEDQITQTAGDFILMLNPDVEMATVPAEDWSFQGEVAFAFFLGSYIPDVDTIAVVQDLDGRCFKLNVMHSSGCTNCAQIGRGIIESIEKQ